MKHRIPSLIPADLSVGVTAFTPIRAYGAASYRESFAGAVLMATVAGVTLSTQSPSGITYTTGTGYSYASVAPGATGQAETRATGQSSISLASSSSGLPTASSARGQTSAASLGEAASAAETTEGATDQNNTQGSATEN